MSADLQSYLCEFSPRPFVRGVSDCCALAAGWIERVGGRPVACQHLGHDLTDRQAASIIASEGGLARYAREIISRHGWELRDGPPQDGDVIVAERNQLLSPTLLGIWSAGHLVTTSRQGMRLIPADEIMEMEAWHGR
jgi:hypothetical protein